MIFLIFLLYNKKNLPITIINIMLNLKKYNFIFYLIKFNLLYYIFFSACQANQINYAISDQINLSDKKAYSVWERDTVQSSVKYENGMLYSTSLNGKFYCYDISKRNIVWKIDLPSPVARRGFLLAREGLFIPAADGVYLISKSNGEVLRIYKSYESSDPQTSYLSPQTDGTNLFVANFIGGVNSFDIKTGKLNWSNRLWNDNSIARVWSGFTINQKWNDLYVVTGDASNNSLAKNSKIYNTNKTFSNSFIVLDMKSGHIKYKFQEKFEDSWDEDLVSNPLVYGNNNNLVSFFSKSGKSYFVKIVNIKNINKYEITNVIDLIGENTSKVFMNKNGDSLEIKYANNKLKKNNFADLINNYEEVYWTIGVSGGVEWMGGILDKKNIYLPLNRVPFLFYASPVLNEIGKSKFESNELTTFRKYCSHCHGQFGEGLKFNELYGSVSAPHLFNITDEIKKEKFDFNLLKKIHSSLQNDDSSSAIYEQFNELSYRRTRLNLNRIYRFIDTYFDNQYIHKFFLFLNKIFIFPDSNWLSYLTNEDLLNIYNIFSNFNNENKSKYIDYVREWRPLLKTDGIPLNNDKAGEIIKINLVDNKIEWRKPAGFQKIEKNIFLLPGSKIFGGLSNLDDRYIILSGSTDSGLHIYEKKSGNIIQSIKLEAAGSAPPTVFTHKGCTKIALPTYGGRYLGYKDRSSSITIISNKYCKEDPFLP